MKYTHTLNLDGKVFPIMDVRDVNFKMVPTDEKREDFNVSLDIKTENNGDFHYECLFGEKEKFSNLFALRTDIIGTLDGIASGRIPPPEA